MQAVGGWSAWTVVLAVLCSYYITYLRDLATQVVSLQHLFISSQLHWIAPNELARSLLPNAIKSNEYSFAALAPRVSLGR